MRVTSTSLFLIASGIALAPLAAAAYAPDCSDFVTTCARAGSGDYTVINDVCASFETSVPSCDTTVSGKPQHYSCCKMTAGCKDTCVTSDKCVSSDTQLAEDKTSLDCPIGETCCAFTPRPSPSSEAAKEGASPATPSYKSEAPLKTGNPYGYVPPLGPLTVNQIVGRVIQAALPIIGALFLFMFLYGGFLWMTAGGEEKQVLKARQTLMQAFIGMVIVIGAYIIIFNVINLLGSTLMAPVVK